MQTYHYDVVVIGGGPAGLGAALNARSEGATVALIERNDELGGILNQCIHSGFGLQYFGEELTGPEYAERFIDRVKASDINCYLNTMVLDITKEKQVQAMNEEGTLVFEAGAIVLAMGCRERTRGAIKIPGSRPAGVYTAGLAQRYVNMDNKKPGRRYVILGSGDIGLIMARRLTLEGMEVAGVYELMPYPNGLYRNIINCLNDFDIPLHLSTTVTKVIGDERVEAVEVSKVDEHFVPIPGTEEIVPCDTLLLSVGLIPENELSQKIGVAMDGITSGPIVDELLSTNVPGVFACGNVLHVHDLVDNVTLESEVAGKAAAAYALGKLAGKPTEKSYPLSPVGEVRYTVPKQIHKGITEDVIVKFRVGRPLENGKTIITAGDEVLYESKRAKAYVPSIMEEVRLTPELVGKVNSDIKVVVEEV